MGALAGFLGTTPAIFVGLTLILIGGAAMLAGRAVGGNWKPAWQVVAACFGLALADRFLTYALFQGELLNLPGLIVNFAVLSGLGLVSWRIAKVGKMVSQYPWLYERSGPLSWRNKQAG